jgi:hypothetical protein
LDQTAARKYGGAGLRLVISRRFCQMMGGDTVLARSTRELFRIGNEAPNVADQRFELDRFGIELVAARGNGRLALAVQRIRGHAYDRDVAGVRILLEVSHWLPAVNDRHFEVHQNYVGMRRHGQFEALLALLRRENLEIALSMYRLSSSCSM